VGADRLTLRVCRKEVLPPERSPPSGLPELVVKVRSEFDEKA
jgi:hypothetical protein